MYVTYSISPEVDPWYLESGEPVLGLEADLVDFSLSITASPIFGLKLAHHNLLNVVYAVRQSQAELPDTPGRDHWLCHRCRQRRTGVKM